MDAELDLEVNGVETDDCIVLDRSVDSVEEGPAVLDLMVDDNEARDPVELVVW